MGQLVTIDTNLDAHIPEKVNHYKAYKPKAVHAPAT